MKFILHPLTSVLCLLTSAAFLTGCLGLDYGGSPNYRPGPQGHRAPPQFVPVLASNTNGALLSPTNFFGANTGAIMRAIGSHVGGGGGSGEVSTAQLLAASNAVVVLNAAYTLAVSNIFVNGSNALWALDAAKQTGSTALSNLVATGVTNFSTDFFAISGGQLRIKTAAVLTNAQIHGAFFHGTNSVGDLMVVDNDNHRWNFKTTSTADTNTVARLHNLNYLSNYLASAIVELYDYVDGGDEALDARITVLEGGGGGSGIGTINGLGTNTTIYAQGSNNVSLTVGSKVGQTNAAVRIQNTNSSAQNALSVFPNNNRVGIGTNTPGMALDVQGDVKASGTITSVGTGTFGSVSAGSAMVSGATVLQGSVSFGDSGFTGTDTVIKRNGAGSSLTTSSLSITSSNATGLHNVTQAGTNSSAAVQSGTIAATNVALFGWVPQGRNTNQVIDASKTNRVTMAPSNSTTVAFANLPAAGTPEQTIELMVFWTNMPAAATFTWPVELVWPQGTPVLVNNATNFFDIKWKGGTNWFGFAYQGPSTGGSTNVGNVSPTIFTPVLSDPTINGQTITLPLVQRVATNYAHASSIAVNCSTDVAAAITNSTSGNVSLLLTNVVPNTSGRLSVTSDGSVRTFNVFAGVSITMLSTNETLNSTQLVTTASKRLLINWAATLETPTKTNLLVWAKSQP